MSQNPDWPLIDEAISFQTGPNSAMPAPYWCSVIARTEGGSASKRGRQYELDQVQTGTSSLLLQNTDGALDPDNTGSIFWPQVTSYRAHRRRAQYPATVNLLTADQATAGAASGLALGAVLPQWVAGVTVAPTLVSSPHANAYSVPGGASGTGVGFVGWSVAPGGTYSFQYVVQSVAASDSCYVKVIWYGPTGSAVGSTTTNLLATSSPVRKTSTVTAPAGACGGQVIIGGGAGVVSVWNVQVEQAGAASTWVQPSTWFDLVTDYVERWPQTWDEGGTYGMSSLECVDAFGYLSQRKLLSPAYMELLALGPSFLYPLDETAGSLLFYDLAAALPPVGQLIPGVATFAAGASLTTPLGTVLPQGISGPSTKVTGALDTDATVILDLSNKGPVGPPVGSGWTFTIAFQMNYTTAPAHGETLWWSAPPGVGVTGFPFIWLVTEGSPDANPGTVQFAIVGPSGATLVQQHFGAYLDAAWHQVTVVMAGDGKTVTGYYDGALVFTATTAADMRFDCSGGSEYLGGVPFVNKLAPNGVINVITSGSLALVGELPFPITAGQASLLWSTFRFGGSGLGVASSTTRYQDVLRWGQWAGSHAEDDYATGECVNYGPAVELLASSDQSGTDVVSALQSVVDSENGNHFVAKNGTVTLKARRARYNQLTVVATFGENVAGGEVPYVDAGFGHDPALLGNDAQITQTTTGNTVRVADQSSVGIYGDVPLQRNVNSLSVLELSDAANYLVQGNKTPRQRLESVTVDVAAYPGAWPVLLGLELGSRVRVNRRPPGAPALGFDGFVESIAWSLTDLVGATCTLEISPLTIGQNLSQLTASRAPLNASVLAGVSALVVNVATDAGGNSPQQNGWTATAMPIVTIWDGTNSETVGVTGMTYAGQLVTISFTPALGHNHTAGVIVSEYTVAGGVTYAYNQFDSVALLDGTHALAY